jgi:ABC-type Mn2+/Zn2+ transport system ATPase subunit
LNQDPVRVECLTVVYGSRRALEEVTFTVPAGCIVGVIGPNGAGKSTLFRAMLGLLPHAGTARLDGVPAYVPQGDRAALDFPATALDVTLMGRYASTPWWRPLGRRQRAVAEAALDEVGMAPHAGCVFGELSGGQRQRVILARALAHGGRVMLLDEPLTGVDAASASVIQATMSRLRDEGVALLVATHDLNDAARTCDRLLFLNRRVMAYGTPAETFTADTLTRTYEGTLLVLDPTDGTPIGVLDEGAHHDHDHSHDRDHPSGHRHDGHDHRPPG